MIDINYGKKGDDKLISIGKISTASVTNTPFENKENLFLSRDFSTRIQGDVSFHQGESGEIFLETSGGVRFNIAENQINNAVKDLNKFPNNAFLLNNLGLAYLNNKQFDKAEASFKEAIKIKPDFKVAFLNLAKTCLLNNDDKNAMAIYRDLIKIYPNDSKILMNIGNVYLKNKELNEAIEVFKNILKIEPKNIASRNQLALIYLVKNNVNDSISELRKCIKLNISIPAIYNNLGVAYAIAGFLNKAVEAFKISLKLFPSYTFAVINLAKAFRQQEAISAAINLLEDYLENNENLEIRELIAKYYNESRLYQKALASLKLVLKYALQANWTNEALGRIYNNLGVIYHNIGDFTNAEANYFTSLKKNAKSSTLIENIIDLYFSLGNLDKAKEYIDILYDNFKDASNYLYYFGKYQYATNQIIEAKISLEKFLTTNKRFLPVYAFLSFIYSENFFEYQKAIDLIKKGLELFPRDNLLINNLAYNYLMANDINNAKIVLEKVKEVKDNILLIATNGLLQFKLGNIEEGRRLYNEAARFANSSFLQKQVMQKKNLELAKIYLANNRFDLAKDCLTEALSIKIEDSIYTVQADKLIEKLA